MSAKRVHLRTRSGWSACGGYGGPWALKLESPYLVTSIDRVTCLWCRGWWGRSAQRVASREPRWWEVEDEEGSGRSSVHLRERGGRSLCGLIDADPSDPRLVDELVEVGCWHCQRVEGAARRRHPVRPPMVERLWWLLDEGVTRTAELAERAGCTGRRVRQLRAEWGR